MCNNNIHSQEISVRKKAKNGGGKEKEKKKRLFSCRIFTLPLSSTISSSFSAYHILHTRIFQIKICKFIAFIETICKYYTTL